MKTALKYGFIYAGLSILVSLLLYVTGLNRTGNNWIPSLLGLAVPVICIILAVKELKSESEGGYIKFAEVFKKGLLICLIGGVLNSAYSMIYLEYIDPTYMDYIMEQQVQKMQENGLSEEQIEKMLQSSQAWQSPFAMFTFSLLGSLFSGAIISLIMAAILKKPNPEEIS